MYGKIFAVVMVVAVLVLCVTMICVIPAPVSNYLMGL